MTATPEETSRDGSWIVSVDHSAYYAWEPIRDSEAFTVDEAGERAQVDPTMVLVDSYYRGFKMRRILVEEPTNTTTTVNLPNLAEGRALTLPQLVARLVRHLEDGPWPKHFPLGSITAVHCDDAQVERLLGDYFVAAA